jgi:L-threonylcarbamoyladenylate synthase
MPSVPEHIAAAVAALRNSGLIAYPTEAVWGLGCDPLDEQAVRRLLALKQRDWRKGVILVAADMAQLAPYLRGLDAEKCAVLRNSWPGPNTWLVPDNGAAPSWITGGHSTLAVRVSAHPVVAALCRAYGGAIVSTSANTAGDLPARSAEDVTRYFGDGVDLIVQGAVGDAKNPTQIRNLMTGEICRTA